MKPADAFDPKTPLSPGVMDTIGYLDQKDAAIARYRSALEKIATHVERATGGRAGDTRFCDQSCADHMIEIAREALDD